MQPRATVMGRFFAVLSVLALAGCATAPPELRAAPSRPLGPMPGGEPLPGESIVLVPGYRTGQRWAFESVELTRTSSEGAAISTTQVLSRGTFEITESRGGIPIALRVAYDPASRATTTVHVGLGSEDERTPTYAGLTVVFRAGEAGGIAIDCPASVTPDDRAGLRKAASVWLDPPTHFPPASRSVRAGDTWRHGVGGDHVDCRLAAVRRAPNGARLAAIEVTITSAAYGVVQRGTLFCDVETGAKVAEELAWTLDQTPGATQVSVHAEQHWRARLVSAR